MQNKQSNVMFTVCDVSAISTNACILSVILLCFIMNVSYIRFFLHHLFFNQTEEVIK